LNRLFVLEELKRPKTPLKDDLWMKQGKREKKILHQKSQIRILLKSICVRTETKMILNLKNLLSESLKLSLSHFGASSAPLAKMEVYSRTRQKFFSHRIQ